MPSAFSDGDLLKEFYEEADEHLSALEDGLMSFEASVQSGEHVDPELVEALFRSTHTLKGLSAMFDLVEVKTLAHDIESVFDGLRKKTHTLDASGVAVLLDAVDVLRATVQGTVSGQVESLGVAELGNRVRELLGDSNDLRAAAAETVSDAELSEYATQRLTEAPAEGLSAVRIVLRWGIELRLGRYGSADLENDLGDEGEILDVRPKLESGKGLADLDFANADMELQVIALARRTPQELADAIGTSVERVTLLSASEEAAPGATQVVRATSTGSVRSEAVRVSINRLDELVDLTGEIVTAHTRLGASETELRASIGRDERLIGLSASVKEIGALIGELYEHVMQLRMVPIGQMFRRFPRVVRDIAQASGKEIELRVEGEETELDKRLIEQIEDALLHLVRNACDHGVEMPAVREAAGKPRAAAVTLSASQEGNHVIIRVADDGPGIDLDAIRRRSEQDGISLPDRPSPEALAELLMTAGFTTAEKVTDVSGRGVGLDVVRRGVVELGGQVELSTEDGVGTTFTLRLPLTLAITPALLFVAHDKTFAAPLGAVSEVLRVRADEIRHIKKLPVLDVREETLALVDLAETLGIAPMERSEGKIFVVIVAAAGSRFGIVVDRLLGQQEIVVKNIEEALGASPGVSGATILGDGSVVPILDVDMIARLTRRSRESVSTATSQEVKTDA